MEYTSILFPSDSFAVGHYRLLWPTQSCQTLFRGLNMITSSRYIVDANFYKGIRSVRLQRPATLAQSEFFTKFLKPLSCHLGFWLITDCDDLLCPHTDIPSYNVARPSFNEHTTDALRSVFQISDFITVTTPIIAKHYSDFFNIPIDKFIIVPNYLPRWWMGDFHLPHIMEYQKKQLKKPKICIAGGANHVDINNQNSGIDDYTGVVEWIRNSVSNYEFHFTGGVPQQLRDLQADGKIFADPPCDILNYPRELKDRHYNLWIVPLQDNQFNRCKSNIKLLESWSLGIPSLVQKVACYEKFTDNTFADANELQTKVDRLFSSPKIIEEEIKKGRNIVDFGDENAPRGWWLEKNIQIHHRLFTLPQRTMNLVADPKQATQIDGEGDETWNV